MVTKQINVPAAQGEVAVNSGVAQYLVPAVIDLIALSVNGKQAHWHVRGANFIGVHEYLDTIIDNAREAYDTLAERVVALGLPLDARIETVAARNSLPTLSEGFQPSSVVVREIVAQLDAVRETIYTAIKGLEEIDPVSQDLVIAVAETLDKDRWFIFSHYAE